MAKILIVEQQKELAVVLKNVLTHEQHLVDLVDNGAAGLERLLFSYYDLCAIEWHANLLCAVEVCAQYRSAGGTARIMAICDGSSELAMVQVLDAGADDCIVKPLSVLEFNARVRALLRRPTYIVGKVFRFDEFTFDADSRRLMRDGHEIRLQPKEYQLLEFFLQHPNQFFKAEALLRRVWDSSGNATEATVRTHVKTMRRKLDVAGVPSKITTVPGLGYKICLDEHDCECLGHLPAAEPERRVYA